MEIAAKAAPEIGGRGTDHGVGGLALLPGGALKRGRIVGAWPGLRPSALHEGRYIRSTTDYESLFKGVPIGHLCVSPAAVQDAVFPDSRERAPAEDLFRTG